jgi:hypothetical protein
MDGTTSSAAMISKIASFSAAGFASFAASQPTVSDDKL